MGVVNQMSFGTYQWEIISIPSVKGTSLMHVPFLSKESPNIMIVDCYSVATQEVLIKTDDFNSLNQ